MMLGMDGSTVALVSVVVSGTVGLGAPVLSQKFSAQREERRAEVERERQTLQFEHERYLRDSQELRILLDEAAITLEAGFRAAVHLIADFKLRSEQDEAALGPAMQRLQTATDTVEQIAARLTIRLGTGHDIPALCNKASLRYRAALDAVVESVKRQARESPAADTAVRDAQEASAQFLHLAKDLAY